MTIFSTLSSGQRNQPRAARLGFSMVETAVCTLLVGLLLVAATQSASSSLRMQIEAANSVKASGLADSLMSEILACSYMEPGTTSSGIGRETGEYSTWKIGFDDVDDFNGWQEQPPQYRDGTIMSNHTGWKRNVTVQWISIGNDGTISMSVSETNHKRITVNVSFHDTLVASREALVTNL